MGNFFENMADMTKGLFTALGFWGASAVLLLIGIIAGYLVIKNRYENLYICKFLGDEYSKLKEKGKDDEVGVLLVKNGYMVLGLAYISMIKVVLGIIYGFILRSNTLSFLDLSFTQFPLKNFGYEILAVPDKNRTTIIFFALIFAWVQSIINKSLQRGNLVDTGKMDFFISAAVFAICLIAPAGTCFYVLGFTIIECIITSVNLFTPLRESGEKKIEKKLSAAKKNEAKKTNKEKK